MLPRSAHLTRGTTARSRGLLMGLPILAHPPVSPSLRFTCRLSKVLRTPSSLLHHIMRLIRTLKGLLCCTRPPSALIRKMRQPNYLPRTAPSRMSSLLRFLSTPCRSPSTGWRRPPLVNWRGPTLSSSSRKVDSLCTLLVRRSY